MTRDMNTSAPLPRKNSKRRRGNETISLHRLPKCEATGKVRYRDHAQANDGLVSAKEWRKRSEAEGRASRRREARSYKCPDCRGWHSTSIAEWIESPRVDHVTSAAQSITFGVSA